MSREQLLSRTARSTAVRETCDLSPGGPRVSTNELGARWATLGSVSAVRRRSGSHRMFVPQQGTNIPSFLY